MISDARIAQYVGLPYIEGGTGPEAYNCWGLLVHIEEYYFDRHIPALDVTNQSECISLFAEMVKLGQWEMVDIPQDGDGVLLRGGVQPHVGVYLNGGVLHSLEPDGVIWTPKRHTHRMFGRTKYYRFHHERQPDDPYRSVPPPL